MNISVIKRINIGWKRWAVHLARFLQQSAFVLLISVNWLVFMYCSSVFKATQELILVINQLDAQNFVL